MIELIILFVAFIVLSGMMSLIDAALLSVSRAEIEELVIRKSWGAQSLKLLSRHMTRAVIVVVILSNITNVLGPILVGEAAIRLFGSDIIGVITALLAFCTIIFSEIVPKSLARHNAPTIARAVAPVLLNLIRALYPLVLLLEWLVHRMKRGRRAIGTEEQIRALTKIGRLAGHIHAYEGHIVQRAFVLNDKTTADVMTPAAQVIFIPEIATVRDAAEAVFKHTYSRFPVVGHKGLDEVKGLAMSRNILAALSEGKDDEPVTKVMTHIQSVDAAMRADQLLLFLRQKRTHLAMVTKDGKTVGLVTLEDVLEELVGEIEDEEDIRRYTTRMEIGEVMEKGDPGDKGNRAAR